MFNQDQIATITRKAEEVLAEYLDNGDELPRGYKISWTGEVLIKSNPALGHHETAYKFKTVRVLEDGLEMFLAHTWLDEDSWDVDPADWLRDNS